MSGERKGVIYKAGDTVVADVFYAWSQKMNSYNVSTGVYTAKFAGGYRLQVLVSTSSSQETLALVIDGVTQPQSGWVKTSTVREGFRSYCHTLHRRRFYMNTGRRLWLKNTVGRTMYSYLKWTLYV